MRQLHGFRSGFLASAPADPPARAPPREAGCFGEMKGCGENTAAEAAGAGAVELLAPAEHATAAGSLRFTYSSLLNCPDIVGAACV